MTNSTRAPNRSDDRIPPHNIDAEESALSAALLSPKAAEALLERLEPGDFYKMAHGLICSSMRSLTAQSMPIDTITVSDTLRRMGALEQVGGMEYLHELQNSPGSIGSVAAYCKIVRDCAVSRRMLYAAADLSDAAYAETDPERALAKAQEVLGKLVVDGATDTPSSLDIADIAALLETDLEPEQGLYLTRSDGLRLIYGGKVHVFQAEPSSGKSWVACAAVAEVLGFGGSAIWLDYEDTPSGILRRMRYLGVPNDALRDRFQHVRPAGKHGASEHIRLERMLEQMNPDLVIIDGVGESLSRNGLSEDKADDFLRWADMLPRPIAATGAAVLMIDHVAKDPEQRGRWARGTGAKLGSVDGASYQLKVVTPFSRKRAGAVKLVIAKDRPGGVGAIGETAAVVLIEPYGDGERVIIKVEQDTATLPTSDSHVPTHVMEQISEAIASAKVPIPLASLEHLIPAKERTVKTALARLLADGFVTRSPKRPYTLHSVKPYHGPTSRAEPIVEEEPPPTLFLVDEPEHLVAERRALADMYSTDPTL